MFYLWVETLTDKFIYLINKIYSISNQMKKTIWSFLFLIVFYHVIITIFWYWFFPQLDQTKISIFRDLLWIIIVCVCAIWNIKSILPYLKKRKYIRITFGILIIFWIWISLLNNKWLSDIFIGLKYWFYYLWILLSASFIWFVWYKKLNKDDFLYFLYFILWIVIFGFIWQIAKIIYPDFFLNIGYGALNDFFYGQNPPLYYLTWFEWTMRRQWLFAGPNNYGYFLVGFFPILLIWIGKIKKQWKKIRDKINILDLFLIFLWISAVVLTLGRWTFIGIVFAGIITYTAWIRKHKKIFTLLLWIFILAIAALSIIKWESTLWHIQSKLSILPYVFKNSLGYWLGSSGPAIHHNWQFLPENYFFQLLLDIGSLGFIIWALLIQQIIGLFRKIFIYSKNNKLDEKQKIWYLYTKAFFVWFFCLLIVWIFLHVFEDSMVNYLFFIPMWIVLWYLTHYIDDSKKEDIFRINKK